MRRLLATLIAMPLVACADDPEPPVYCDPGEGPIQETVSYKTFDASNLTCLQHDQVWGCTGECCHVQPIGSASTTTIACDSRCLGLDEATCLADAACFVARDRDKFFGGAPDSFIGCFPVMSSSNSSACSSRSSYNCPDGGTCAGLYSPVGSGFMFVGCIDETVTP